jgi:hypothetical protein
VGSNDSHENKCFDGDELNFTVLLDEWTIQKADLMAPETNMFNLKHINETSDAVQIPKPVAGTIASWLEDTTVDPEIQKKMAALQA